MTVRGREQMGRKRMGIIQLRFLKDTAKHFGAHQHIFIIEITQSHHTLPRNDESSLPVGEDL